MTPHQAKAIAAKALTDFGWTFDKLTAKTVSFVDLARSSALFVQVHGLAYKFSDYERPTRWAHAKEQCKNAGFILELR